MESARKPLFPLGRLTATPGFLSAVPRPAMVDAIRRYATGDFGDMSPDEASRTLRCAQGGLRVQARYRHDSTPFIITTDPDRSITRIYLPHES